MSNAVQVSALYEYPMKSCRGTAVETLDFDRLGPIRDRRWMAVQESNGRFLSQREFPQLARVVAGTSAAGAFQLSVNQNSVLEVEPPLPSSPLRHVRVWKDQFEALDAGEDAARWLQALLGIPARLVRVQDNHHRPLKLVPDCVGDATVGFADGYPFLLTSEASLAELNRRLPIPMPMNRFRCNIVVNGCEAFAEDSWRTLCIGEARFALVSACSRCVITTTNQETGRRDGQEPLRTMGDFRRKKKGAAVYFGQNAVQLQTTGIVRIGDRVKVIEWR